MARFNVLTGGTATPVAEPGFGEKWLIPEGASGDWSTHEGEIAIGNGNAGYLYQALVDGDEVFVIDTDTLYLVTGGGTLRQTYPVLGSIAIVLGNGSAVVPTGIAGDVEVPYDCEIVGWSLLADQSGSIAVDVWKDSYANFPPTVDDTIIESGAPVISSATKAESSSLAGWTVQLSAGDVLRINVDSASDITRATFTLRLRR